MARRSHYSPQISRFLVSALYHEAKRRKMGKINRDIQIIQGEVIETKQGRVISSSRSGASRTLLILFIRYSFPGFPQPTSQPTKSYTQPWREIASAIEITQCRERWNGGLCVLQ